MSDIYNLGVKEFSAILGIEEKEMPEKCVDIINSKDFRYRYYPRNKRDKIILDIMKRIDANIFSKSGEGKKEIWRRGWQEILDNFIKAEYNKKALIPQFFRAGRPIFLFSDYVESMNNYFENDFVELLRMFIACLYLKNHKNIYEFGCGSCANLYSFCETFPGKNYYGYDWVEQSKLIINKIRESKKYNIYGGVFDMFSPDYDLEVRDNSVSLTFGAMEQLGERYSDFLQFLLDKPFLLHVHVNSILEFYDTDESLTDYLIYKLEVNRNYLRGFFTKLMRMEKEGKIEIIKMHRVKCGSIFGDGYSITVWRKL